MAVFPDRIVQKFESAVPDAVALSIADGAAAAIIDGEIVLSLQPGRAAILTRDSVGNIVQIGGFGQVNVTTSATDDILIYNGTEWVNKYYKDAFFQFKVEDLADYGHGLTLLRYTYRADYSATPASGEAALQQAAGQTDWYFSTVDADGTDQCAVFTGMTPGTLVKARIYDDQRNLVAVTSDANGPYDLDCVTNQKVALRSSTELWSQVKDLGWTTGQVFYIALEGHPTYVTPSNGNTLVYQDGLWQPGSVGGGGTLVSSTAPTVDANGDPLVEGATWFDTDDAAYYVYYNSAWVQTAGGGSGGATTLGGLNDVTLSSNSAGDVLSFNGSAWVNTALGIDDLSDVDTTTTTPTDGQVLTWVNANSRWEPVNASGLVDSVNGQTGIVSLGVQDLNNVSTTPPTDGQVLTWVDINSQWEPVSVAGGGGGSGAAGSFLTETQTASSGAATFTGLGHSGLFRTITSTLDAWVVFYGSAADRTADAGRAFNTAPATSSGVLAEVYVTASTPLLFTPGTSYFNNDTIPSEAIYVAVRDQAGANVDAQLTVDAFGQVTTIVGSRQTVNVTTASIADAASDDVTLTGTGAAGDFVAIETDKAAWVVVYSDTASRTADSGRAETTAPVSGSGVLLEVVTTGAERIKLTPHYAYFNDESTPASELYLKVTNKSGSSGTVTITTTVVPSED